MPEAALLPVTDPLADEVLSIPVRPDLTVAEIDASSSRPGRGRPARRRGCGATPADEHDEGHEDERERWAPRRPARGAWPDTAPWVATTCATCWLAMTRGPSWPWPTRRRRASTTRGRAASPRRRDVFADPHSLMLVWSVKMDAVVVAIPTTLDLGVALDPGHRTARGGPRGEAIRRRPSPKASGDRPSRPKRQPRVLLQVGHIERFNPAVLELARRLRAGALSLALSAVLADDPPRGSDAGTHPGRRRGNRPGDARSRCHPATCPFGAQPTRTRRECLARSHRP